MAWIYLMSNIENPNIYKIGMTKAKDIDKRKKQLQTGNPNILFVNHAFETKYPFKVETMLHNKFAFKKILNEWFELDKNDVENFIDTCQQFEHICEELKDNPFF